MTGERMIPQGGSIPIACDCSNINPVAIALLRVKLPNGNYYIPGSGITPNPSAGISGTRQQLFSIPAKYREDQYIGNGDWIISANHSLQARYFDARNPYEYQLNGQLPGRVQTDGRSDRAALVRLASILRPVLVCRVRVSPDRILERAPQVIP